MSAWPRTGRTGDFPPLPQKETLESPSLVEVFAAPWVLVCKHTVSSGERRSPAADSSGSPSVIDRLGGSQGFPLPTASGLLIGEQLTHLI